MCVPAHSYSGMASWVVFLESAAVGVKGEPSVALNLFGKTDAPYVVGDEGTALKKRAKGVVCDMEEWRKLTEVLEEAAICAANMEPWQGSFCKGMANRVVANHPDLLPEAVDFILDRRDISLASLQEAEKVSKEAPLTPEQIVSDFRFAGKRWVRMVLFLRILKGVTASLDAEWKEKHSTPKKGQDEGLPPSPPALAPKRASSKEAKKKEKRDLDKEGRATPLSRKKLDMTKEEDREEEVVCEDDDDDDIDNIPSSQALV